MNQLPSVESTLSVINNLAKIITDLLQVIDPIADHPYVITPEYTLEFYQLPNTFEVYTIGSTLYIPHMSQKKLQGLMQFFCNSNLPGVIYHECQHLVDTALCIEHNLRVSVDTLEARATLAENLLVSCNK